jgi:hypothetical protein
MMTWLKPVSRAIPTNAQSHRIGHFRLALTFGCNKNCTKMEYRFFIKKILEFFIKNTDIDINVKAQVLLNQQQLKGD